MYRELKDDPKMGELNDATFRVFVESLCWACEREERGNTGLTLATANWAFRRNVTEPLLELLQKRMLIENDANEICVTNWEKRQRASDSSAERVRKYRAKQNVTLRVPLQKRPCNGAEESRGDQKRVEGEANPPAHFSEIPTEAEAVAATATAGIADDFCRWVYADWSNRAGKDAGGVPVRWLGYVTKRWAREQIEWKAGTHKGKARAGEKPNPRNEGTGIDAREQGRKTAEFLKRKQLERERANATT